MSADESTPADDFDLIVDDEFDLGNEDSMIYDVDLSNSIGDDFEIDSASGTFETLDSVVLDSTDDTETKDEGKNVNSTNKIEENQTEKNTHEETNDTMDKNPEVHHHDNVNENNEIKQVNQDDTEIKPTPDDLVEKTDGQQDNNDDFDFFGGGGATDDFMISASNDFDDPFSFGVATSQNTDDQSEEINNYHETENISPDNSDQNNNSVEENKNNEDFYDDPFSFSNNNSSNYEDPFSFGGGNISLGDDPFSFHSDNNTNDEYDEMDHLGTKNTEDVEENKYNEDNKSTEDFYDDPFSFSNNNSSNYEDPFSFGGGGGGNVSLGDDPFSFHSDNQDTNDDNVEIDDVGASNDKEGNLDPNTNNKEGGEEEDDPFNTITTSNTGEEDPFDSIETINDFDNQHNEDTPTESNDDKNSTTDNNTIPDDLFGKNTKVEEDGEVEIVPENLFDPSPCVFDELGGHDDFDEIDEFADLDQGVIPNNHHDDVQQTSTGSYSVGNTYSETSVDDPFSFHSNTIVSIGGDDDAFSSNYDDDDPFGYQEPKKQETSHNYGTNPTLNHTNNITSSPSNVSNVNSGYYTPPVVNNVANSYTNPIRSVSAPKGIQLFTPAPVQSDNPVQLVQFDFNQNYDVTTDEFDTISTNDRTTEDPFEGDSANGIELTRSPHAIATFAFGGKLFLLPNPEKPILKEVEVKEIISSSSHYKELSSVSVNKTLFFSFFVIFPSLTLYHYSIQVHYTPKIKKINYNHFFLQELIILKKILILLQKIL